MTYKKIGIGERADWNNFPNVIRNGNLGDLKKEPEYEAAKAGDSAAAVQLISKLITDDFLDAVKEKIEGRKDVLLLPTLAVEQSGNNKIPLAMAKFISRKLGIDTELKIVQSYKVGRTNQGADYRLAFNPEFEGEVQKDRQYLILDDTLTMGGTIASLRGYVENRGGKVVLASVMTAHQGALQLPIKKGMLDAINNKHGLQVNEFWKETFGYGIEKLTQGEAGHIRAAKTFDEIRNRITATRHEGVIRLYGETNERIGNQESSHVIARKEIMAEVQKVMPLNEQEQHDLEMAIDKQLAMAAQGGKTLNVKKVKENIKKGLPYVRKELEHAGKQEKKKEKSQERLKAKKNGRGR